MRRIPWLGLVLVFACTTAEDASEKAPGMGGALAVKIKPREASKDKEAETPSVPSPTTVRPEAVEVTTPGAGTDLKLEPTASGGFRHVDREAGFAATIRPDGLVTFRNLGLQQVDGPAPDESGARDPREGNDAGMETIPTFNGDDGPMPVLGSVGARVGAAGQMNTPAKRKFLEQTASLRASMAAKTRTSRLEKGVAQSGVVAISALKDGSKPLPQRKRTVFDLWDQSLEMRDGLSDADKEAAEAGEQARRKIEKAVAQTAPKGSKLAYTDSEVEWLNGIRISKQRFDPYGSK